ncbi:MAG TPA: hypothetical protein VMW35_02720 [Myxococcota bacterium]|nr:hypothetical protein [Myxococcota bacterium]
MAARHALVTVLSLFVGLRLLVAPEAGGVVLQTAVGGAPDPTPRVIPLGDMPGDRDSSAPVAVSVDGSVAIANGMSAHGPEAFRWTAATGSVGLGDLPGGGFFSVARFASQDASVVVGLSSSDLGTVPFRWTAATGMQALIPSPGGQGCDVSATSPSGDAIVGDCEKPFVFATLFRSGWIWTAAGGFHRLTGLPWSGVESAALDVSADGKAAIGWRANGSSVRELVRFEAGPDGVFESADDRAAQLVGITMRPEPDSDPVYASADARVVVGYGVRLGREMSFRWTAGRDGIAGTSDDTIDDLSYRGRAFCLPTGISDDGTTPFGVCGPPTGPIFPVRWSTSQGWTRLGTAPMGSQGGLATAAAANGSAIVGFFEVKSGPAPWNTVLRPFRWTSKAGLSLFATVAPEQAACDRCVVVSSDGGDVLGAEGSPQGDGLFLWSAGHGRRHFAELPGDWYGSLPTGLSDDGLVAAGKAMTAAGFQAFRWTETGGTAAVGPPSTRSLDVALSDDGATLLGVASWDRERHEARSAFLWHASTGSAASLGSGFAGSPACYPTALSGDGTAVVGGCAGGAQAPAFRWTAATGVLPLQLPSDHNDWACSASAVSQHGDVVGMTCRRPIGGSELESRALLWRDLGAPLVDVDAPWSVGDVHVELRDLSSDGAVAIADASPSRTGPWQTAIVWTAATGARTVDTAIWPGRAVSTLDVTADGALVLGQAGGLPYLYDPATGGRQAIAAPFALDKGTVHGGLISDDGSTAFVAYEVAGPDRGLHAPPATRIWLWDATNGGRWLDDALTGAGVDVGSASLERVVDVSRDGKRLLGYGMDANGTLGAWLAVLP